MTNNIKIKEGNFTARILKSDELEKAYQFRYEIFHKELKWFPPDKEKRKIDTDMYDQFSIHFGVFTGEEKLIGYGRLVLPKSDFMLEREFKNLLTHTGYVIRKKKDTVEVSRVVINKNFRSANNFNTIWLLFKAMYWWSVKNKTRYWYMVIELNYLKFLQRLFPLKQIGGIKYYQPNVATAAALLDLREAERFVYNTNRNLHKWFTKL